MFTGYGNLYHTRNDGFLRAYLGEDFGQYYLRLFKYATWNVTYLWRPRHGFHLTVINPKFHKVDANLSFFNNKKISFTYDPRDIHRGGERSGFIGYYLNVISKDIDDIRASLGLDPKKAGRVHLSLFTDKHLKK